MKKTKDYWHCDECNGNFDHGEPCDCQKKTPKLKPFEQLFLDGVEVLYLCDKKACKTCWNPDCHHTNDVSHAIHFRKGPDGNYWEKPYTTEIEKLYFWICPICGANNLPLETCQCGNKKYSVTDMFPIIKKEDAEKLKADINKLFGSDVLNESQG